MNNYDLINIHRVEGRAMPSLQLRTIWDINGYPRLYLPFSSTHEMSTQIDSTKEFVTREAAKVSPRYYTLKELDKLQKNINNGI